MYSRVIQCGYCGSKFEADKITIYQDSFDCPVCRNGRNLVGGFRSPYMYSNADRVSTMNMSIQNKFPNR